MKSHLFSGMLMVVMALSWSVAYGQFDDLYYDYSKDGILTSSVSSKSVDEGYYDESEYYDGDEYDNYDEYSYSTRINRFHRPVVNNYYYSNFDNWWYNDYYDPYYSGYYGSPNYSVNVFLGSGWGWNRPWGWNSWGWNNVGWNRPWGWNNYGWNSWGWNNPWGYNGWNGGWGCGNNIYYGNVYYGNGMNGGGMGNWNGGNDFTNKIYGSRKGGSLSSAVKGRNASPRREVISGGSGPDNPRLTKDKSDSRASGNTSDRAYKGDIKDRSNVDGDRSGRSSRSRIYNSGKERQGTDRSANPNPNPRTDRSSGSEDRRIDRGSNTPSPSIRRENNDSNSRKYNEGSGNQRSSNSNESSRRSYDSGSSRGGIDSGRSGGGNNSGSSSGSFRSSGGNSGGSSSGRSGGGSPRGRN